jgi:hypothetical protein
MVSSTLLLAPHAHFCVDGDYCIFLDLQNDGYLCVARRDMEVLQGHPRCSTGATFADELVRNGLLTTSNPGKPIAPTRATRPARALTAEARSRGTLQAVRGLLRFLQSSTLAHRELATWPLQRTVEFARQRKARLCQSTPDYSLLAMLVGEYNRWRPFFPRGYLCLFDSLALFELLIRHNVCVEWVYGVQAEPFEAHCWLQTGDLLINETLERVAPFTPIMVV